MIKIKIGDKTNSPVKADDVDEKGAPVITVKLDVRKDIAGNYMIFDHGDIDIVIKPEKGKILCFGKEEVGDTDIVYDACDKLFRFLIKKGVVIPDSVQGGPILGSMQAEFYKEGVPEELSPYQIMLLMIQKFIEEERPYYTHRKAHDEHALRRLYEPSDANSTELGEVPHEEEKGSIPRRIDNWGANYGVYE